MRFSHDSDPTSGHDPCPCPKPKPKAKPNPYAPAGRRGRKEDPRLTTLPSGDHHGQRARLFVAPSTQTNSGCEFVHPLPLPIPTSRPRCPAAPFLSISGPFTNQDWVKPTARASLARMESFESERASSAPTASRNDSISHVALTRSRALRTRAEVSASPSTQSPAIASSRPTSRQWCSG